MLLIDFIGIKVDSCLNKFIVTLICAILLKGLRVDEWLDEKLQKKRKKKLFNN